MNHGQSVAAAKVQYYTRLDKKVVQLCGLACMVWHGRVGNLSPLGYALLQHNIPSGRVMRETRIW